MTDNLTPADLIYLYLDGEADSMQQTTMFASLATDVDLQQEFTEALSMHKAFEHERSTAKPPMYLTQRVFEDAGILSKAVGAGAVGGGLWLWLRRASVPAGAMLLGAIITFLGMNWNGYSKKPVENLATNGSDKTVMIAAQTSSTNSLEVTAQQKSSTASNFVKEERAPRTTARRSVAIASEQNGNGARKVSAPESALDSKEKVHDDGTYTSDDVFNDAFISEKSRITKASMYLSNQGSRRLSMVNVRNESYELGMGKTSDWSLQLNRVVNGDFYAAAHGTPIGVMSDPSVSVFYNLNENLSVGAFYSRSTYSVSGITTSGVALLNPMLIVIGSELQYMGQQEMMLGGQGFARLGVGYSSNTGAGVGVVTSTLGLSFPLISSMRINPGVAFEGIYYRAAANENPARAKMSFVIGVAYNL